MRCVRTIGPAEPAPSSSSCNEPGLQHRRNDDDNGAEFHVQSPLPKPDLGTGFDFQLAPPSALASLHFRQVDEKIVKIWRVTASSLSRRPAVRPHHRVGSASLRAAHNPDELVRGAFRARRCAHFRAHHAGPGRQRRRSLRFVLRDAAPVGSALRISLDAGCSVKAAGSRHSRWVPLVQPVWMMQEHAKSI